MNDIVIQSLLHNLGKDIAQALKDDNVIEIMLNDDSQLWLDTFSDGMIKVAEIAPMTATSIVNQVASMLGTVVNKENPVVEGELPIDGSRFEGLFPPIVRNPSFTIRKKASKLFPLDNYVDREMMTIGQRKALYWAIHDKKNILVVGGTGSGKTTLTNGILAELKRVAPKDRIVIIEDTFELQCDSENKVMLRVDKDNSSMRDLLKATMRLRPDRIIVGEVRGGEALDLLKAWNTGHPGGICTIHANSCIGGLLRLEQLIAEVSVTPMKELISEAVNIVVFIQKENGSRKIKEMIEIINGETKPIGDRWEKKQEEISYKETIKTKDGITAEYIKETLETIYRDVEFDDEAKEAIISSITPIFEKK